MDTVLDESLVYLVRRKPVEGDLTPEEVIAINLFWRKKIPPLIIARAFGRAKNTIYYKCLTGQAPSYPKSSRANKASDTNDLIELLGVEEATRRYVTPEMNAAVNREMAAQLAREQARRDARAARRAQRGNRRRPKARVARS